MHTTSSTRRQFLHGALAGSAVVGAGRFVQADEEPPVRSADVKITAVDTFHLRHELDKEIGPATAYYKTRESILVKISTNAGFAGWGETAPLPGVRALVDDLGRTLVGKNPLEHRKLWRTLWGPNFGNGLAVGALDLALQDVRGKILNRSIAEIYGGRLRDRVPAYAAAMNYTKGVDPLEQYPHEAAGLVKRGFRALKMRLGGLPMNRDIAVAAAVREAVGPDVRLMVDGNGAYTLAAAIRMGRALEELNFHFFEEPLPQQPMYAGYEVLTRQLDIPIAAGEVLDSRATARELIKRRAMRIIQPDVSLCGGIGECLFIAEMAALSGIQCNPHCWGGAIVIAGTLQVLSLLPDTSWSRTTESAMLELDVYENPFRDLVPKLRPGSEARKPFEVRDGHVDVPTGPGLGIEIDEEVVRRYAVPPV